MSMSALLLNITTWPHAHIHTNTHRQTPSRCYNDICIYKISCVWWLLTTLTDCQTLQQLPDNTIAPLMMSLLMPSGASSLQIINVTMLGCKWIKFCSNWTPFYLHNSFHQWPFVPAYQDVTLECTLYSFITPECDLPSDSGRITLLQDVYSSLALLRENREG